MKYTHLRHATGILNYNGLNILIDPMFSPKESLPPISNTWNNKRNPRTELPINTNNFKVPEYCFVTHLHPDHFDQNADEILPKNTALICQSEDLDKLAEMGFCNLIPIDTEVTLKDIHIRKVKGQHGYGETAAAMGTSSGYILTSKDEGTLYITGDTIYYEEVEHTLKEYHPRYILAFAGGAQFSDDFLDPGPITLSCEDLLKIHHTSPNAKIICTHMDALNHCTYGRDDLKKFLMKNDILENAFIIPNDNETVRVL